MALPVTNLTQPAYLRQPREPSRAFAYFQLYRDLGPSRSIAEVCRETAHCYSHMRDVATRWRWDERVVAYENHLDEEKVKEFESAGRTMARRQARLGMLLQEKAEGALEQLVYDSDNAPTAKDIATLADIGVKIERQARGEQQDDGKTIQIVLPCIPDWAKGSQFVKSASPEVTIDMPTPALVEHNGDGNGNGDGQDQNQGAS